MKKFITSLLCLLFYGMASAQIINDFEQGLGSISLNSAIYRNQNSISFSIYECSINSIFGNVFTPPNTLNLSTAKGSIMTAINEPLLSSWGVTLPCVGPAGGKYSLRLNNQGGGQDITSYTQTFRPLSKYLSFNYLAVLDSPHIDIDNIQPFFTVRLLDMNDNIISTAPFCAKASLNDMILTKVSNRLFYTEGFYCQTILIPDEYVNKQNIKVQFVIADCGAGGDVGVVYLDNIRMGDPCESSQFGFIDLDTDGPYCNPRKITITGTYTSPQNTTYLSSRLKILNSAGIPVVIHPSNITMNNFSGGTFSYTVNFPTPLPNGRYEVKVEATFNNALGYTYDLDAQSINPESDIVFTPGTVNTSPLNVIINHHQQKGVQPPYGYVRWEKVPGPYILEYIYDGFCCPTTYGPSKVNQQVFRFEIDENFISAATLIRMINTTGIDSKCLRFRVRTPCKEWSTWCCITTYGWGYNDGGYYPNNPNDPFNICLDEIDFNNLHLPSSSNQTLIAYPNPVNGTITIMNSNSTQFTFYDVNQKIVKQMKINQPNDKVNIDLSDLKKGLYILRTEQEQEIKIIKE